MNNAILGYGPREHPKVCECGARFRGTVAECQECRRKRLWARKEQRDYQREDTARKKAKSPGRPVRRPSHIRPDGD